MHSKLGSSFKLIVLFLLSYTATYAQIPGAYADGLRKDTKVIQAAIDSVSALGGGLVRFTPGKYLTGPFVLKGNNLTVQIDSGATILASKDTVDFFYYPGGDTTKSLSGPVNFISSSGCNNLTIQGKGTIDGQGSRWWPYPDNARPRMLQLERGVGLVVKEVTLTNSPMFHLCPNRYYDVNIHDIRIIAPSTSPNTDGIDPGICHKVRISNCYIDNGDDNIAVGASSPDAAWGTASTDIIIKHCTFLHGHGVSIGSYTSGGIDSMLVDSCTFDGTTNGIRIKSQRGRGGDVRNITYSNLSMSNVVYPIYFTAYYSGIPTVTADTVFPINATTPYFHDIKVINLTSVNPPAFSRAGFVIGVAEKPFTNISFENVVINAGRGLQLRNAALTCDTSLFNIESGPKIYREIRSTVIDTSTHSNSNEAILQQNFPNPFKSNTYIQYRQQADAHVEIRIYNLLGQEVATPVNESETAGQHTAVFNGKSFASGIYFYKLTIGNSSEIKKMIILK